MNEERKRAIAEFTSEETRQCYYLDSLPGTLVGLDGVTVDSCWQNGRDACVELGIVEGAEFSWMHVQNATARFAISTARLFEII